MSFQFGHHALDANLLEFPLRSAAFRKVFKRWTEVRHFRQVAYPRRRRVDGRNQLIRSVATSTPVSNCELYNILCCFSGSEAVSWWMVTSCFENQQLIVTVLGRLALTVGENCFTILILWAGQNLKLEAPLSMSIRMELESVDLSWSNRLETKFRFSFLIYLWGLLSGQRGILAMRLATDWSCFRRLPSIAR